jgi:geranylgeranyl pyrophosphate synthase
VKLSTESIYASITTLPEIAAWPDLLRLLRQHVAQAGVVRYDWQLPALTCEAIGALGVNPTPAAAAIACMQISIQLADDILDDDPRGEHLQLGVGKTANLTLALQAAAFRLITNSSLQPDACRRACDSLAWLALETARGQHLDASNLQGEENYWAVVRAKSTPFYGSALEVGAIFGSASPETALALRGLGQTMGEIIQIKDDLEDALQTPANPDWGQGRNNLLILYARTASYPERERFIQLAAHADHPENLRQAQNLLIASGAASYGVYQIAQRAQSMKARLAGLALPKPDFLLEWITHHEQLVVDLLQTRSTVAP